MSSGTWKWWLAVPAIYFLFFFALTDIGLIGPDEPRYASIGRDMALSGDWVTPRLWGELWFEKPPLLYWMIGGAHRAGLRGELAARLPVVLLSLGFLIFYYRFLRTEFGPRPALFATVILGSSAGWLAYSQLAVTDVPLAVTFSAAMLLGYRALERGSRRMLAVAAGLLAAAVLAKGLVPLVLALPLLWAWRGRLRRFLDPAPVLVFLVIAVPWFAVLAWKTGFPFVEELFLRHHFARFSSGHQLHARPFWFYVPVLLAGFVPWTPAFVLLLRRGLFSDRRRRFLLIWVAFGFLFFSVSAGKLPGYVLPLFPAVAALIGIAVDEARDARWVLAAACATLALVPVITGTLPGALATGLSRARIEGWHWWFAITYCLMAAVIWWWEEAGRRQAAVGLLIFATVLGVVFIKVKAYPAIDRLATARPLWRHVSTRAYLTCVEPIHRSLRYGLNYYSGKPLPDCSQLVRPFRVQQLPGHPPFVN
ncbi:MAG TPA: glycosyltransferase family 39 protein [Bryobacteraceae bacterium]|nr:glycosyltransferase family 39 protein [Bryobacteraceae bacterium]